MARRQLVVAIALVLAAPAAPATAGSLKFLGNGVDKIDRVKISIDPGVPADVGATDFAIELWMKAKARHNRSGTAGCDIDNGDGWITGNIIIDRDIFGAGPDFGVSLANRRLVFGVSNGDEGFTICGTRNVLDNAWHRVVVQREVSGEMRIGVDGEVDAAATGAAGDIAYPDGRPTSYPSSDPFLVLGAEKHDAGASFPSYRGKLDELRITSDGATAALYHFNGTGPCTGTVPDTSGAPGGPSPGRCRHSGSPAGPVYSGDSPV